VNVDGLEWQRAKWNKIGRRVFFEGARLCGKYADELVYDSEALKPHWTATFGVARGVFIPYGADIAEAASEVPIEELGLEIGKFLLVVARLVPENSIDLFLDACALLPAELPIIVVGSGHDREPVVHRLRRVSETRKQVRLLGHVSDQTFLRALWVHCGAYWHGHSVGGTNPALLQAMSSGAPTLALDTPFNAEVLRNPRQLVARDPELLAGRIRALLLSPETQQSWRASQQATIKEFYQWDSVCRRYDEVLQRIA
jgi:glycosyltransferase involved in cell wall biosynthesis